jgi:hypothetical protein
VANLCETATLVRIQIYVVNPERTSGKGARKDASLPAALSEGAELDVDLNLMILESNEGKGKTGVTAEPELEGDVEDGRRHGLSVANGLDKTGDVSNHVGITRLMTRSLGKLVPDVEPVTVVLVNTLATNLDLNILKKNVADPVDPTERLTSSGGNGRECYLKVNTVNKISVTGDGASDLATEISRTIEGLLDRLHSEVSVTTVNYLEEGNLRITG